MIKRCPGCGSCLFNGPRYRKEITPIGGYTTSSYLGYDCLVCGYEHREPTFEQSQQGKHRYEKTMKEFMDAVDREKREEGEG